MARKRYITSAMSGDEKIAEAAELDPIAALAWPWIITNLDDWGRMEVKVREIRLNVFQAFPSFTTATVEQIISTLATARLLLVYEVDGRRYAQANPTAYYKLQTYIPKESKVRDASKIPPPDHPWADFWPESIWKVAESSRNRQSPQKVAETASFLQEPAESGGNCTLSFSSTLTLKEEGGETPDGETSENPPPSRVDKKGAIPAEEISSRWYDLVQDLYGVIPGSKDLDLMENLRRRHDLSDKFIAHAVGSMIEFGRRWEEKMFSPIRFTATRLANWAAQGVRSTTAWDKQMEREDERKADEQKAKADRQQGKDRGAQGDRGQPPKSNVRWSSGEKKDKGYYDAVIKKFPDDPDPPKEGDGRESA